MSFTCFNRNISDEAHEKIKALGPSGVQAFAFTPSGGWVIVTDGGLFARNIPEECYQKLLAYVGDGHKIRVVSFPPGGTGGSSLPTAPTLPGTFPTSATTALA